MASRSVSRTSVESVEDSREVRRGSGDPSDLLKPDHSLARLNPKSLGTVPGLNGTVNLFSFIRSRLDICPITAAEIPQLAICHCSWRPVTSWRSVTAVDGPSLVDSPSLQLTVRHYSSPSATLNTVPPLQLTACWRSVTVVDGPSLQLTARHYSSPSATLNTVLPL